MNKSELQLDVIKSLHHAGRLDEARNGYLALLEKNPRDVDVLHLLGLLCAEAGDLVEARNYINKALVIAPQSVLLKLHLANMMKVSGQLDEAVQVLQQVLAADPECAPAFNNLGTVYFAQKKDELALQAYHAALEIRPDYADAYYNLGLAAARLGKVEEACAAYRALIALAPAHIGAHFQLGVLLMRRRLFVEAAKEFKAVIVEQPFHFESLANLAICELHQGRMHEATKLYLQALDLNADDRETLFNLGVIHMQQGYAHEAVKYYLRAVKSHPDFYEAHYNLGTYYLMTRSNDLALLHFREALRIRPEDEVSRHMIRILTQDPDLAVSSPAYIQSLFDSYADYYDAHMLTHLQYQVPEKLYEMVKRAGVLDANNLDIVDIGCGTGLSGRLFKSHAGKLVGIDLSEKMLAVAAQKNIYDALIPADIVTCLAAQTSKFDLALAGDVLVYFGKLDELIAAVASVLKTHGYFAFNVEAGAMEEFALMASGRFCHQVTYLERLAKEHGFTVRVMQPVTLRHQNDAEVEGYLCLWQR